jgi:hypothetical protein
MKNRRHVLFLSALLLFTIGYEQVFLKISGDNSSLVKISSKINSEAEEGAEKTSGEENRESDADEDSFKLNEMMQTSFAYSGDSCKNVHHSSRLSTYYPEIVSPPPQA